jgi:disulfide bond formation protein DsbB
MPQPQDPEKARAEYQQTINDLRDRLAKSPDAEHLAYYFAIPLAAMVLLGVSVGSSRKVQIAALVAIAAAMLWNAGLGVYHSGVEWQWWPGPQDCSGATPNFSAGGSLLEQIKKTRVVRCDEAAWRFLGLSLAGYNVLISLALAAIAVWGAVSAWRMKVADNE